MEPVSDEKEGAEPADHDLLMLLWSEKPGLLKSRERPSWENGKSAERPRTWCKDGRCWSGCLLRAAAVHVHRRWWSQSNHVQQDRRNPGLLINGGASPQASLVPVPHNLRHQGSPKEDHQPHRIQGPADGQHLPQSPFPPRQYEPACPSQGVGSGL